MVVGRDEGPERGRVEQPVRGRPQHRVLEQLPIRAEGPQPGGETLHELAHLLLGDPGHAPGDGLQRSGGVLLAPGERQHENAERGQQDSADDGDGDVGAVEAMQRDGDHECHPQHGVQDDGGADSLGRERETGIRARDPVRGEEPVAEPGAAGSAAGNHVAHSERRQVDAEHLREARAVLRQHGLRKAPVCSKGSGLEAEAGKEPEEIDAAQLAQRGTCFGVQETWNDHVLEEHEENEERDAVPQWPRYPSEQFATALRRGRVDRRAVDLGQVGHLSMLAGARMSGEEPTRRSRRREPKSGVRRRRPLCWAAHGITLRQPCMELTG